MVLLNFCNKNRQEFTTRILPSKLPIFILLLMDRRVTFYNISTKILNILAHTYIKRLMVHFENVITMIRFAHPICSSTKITVVFFVVNNRHLGRGEEFEKMFYFSKDQELCKRWPIFYSKYSHSCFGFATYLSILNCGAEWQVF